MPARRTTARLAAIAAAVTLAVTSCGSTDSWVDAHPSQGWSAQYGDAANSSYVAVAGAADLRLEWTRSVKGALGSQVALGSTGATKYLAANAGTRDGCSLMVWESDNGARQRWCTRLWQVQAPGGPSPGPVPGPLTGPLFDGFDNLYVGQPGAMLSFPPTQWIRWRQPVIGLPMTPRILDPGHLLVVTHLGQVLVFDAHRGTVVGTSLDLVAGVDPTDSQRGLADCAQGRPRCPVAAAPAFSAATNIVVLPLWEPDADAPVLVGLRYRPGQTPLLAREWTSTEIGGGPLASPVLSADGSTVYVAGRDKRLWALDAADGTTKWSVELGYQPQTPPSVGPDGLVIGGGGPDAKLVAVDDRGSSGEVRWTRDDVMPLSTSSQAGGSVAYTVVRDGDADPAGQALITFDPGDGHTVNAYPLPGSSGFPVGVSIGADRRVVAATSDGQVYGFAPN